jgi:predicted nucleic acid-binding protein
VPPLLVSAVEVHEVYKVIRRDLSEERASKRCPPFAARVSYPSTSRWPLEAAEVSLALGLAMADSPVYATARRHGARLVTSDADFEGLPGAIVVADE